MKKIVYLFLLFAVLFSVIPELSASAETTRLEINHKFTTYDEPSFTSDESATYGAQTVTVLDQQGDFWYLISTNRGDKWVYYNPDLGRKTYDYRFVGYEEPSFSSERATSFSPTTVTVTAKYNDWYQIETTNYGNVWVYDGRLSVPHKFAAYDSPSFTSEQAGTFSSQSVRVVDKKGSYWYQIVTSKYGNKWIYYNPNIEDRLTFSYRFDIYEQPTFNSSRLSSYAPQTVNVTAKHNHWYQIETGKYGLVWVYKQRLSIPHRFSAYDSPSFTSNEAAQFGSQTVTVVEKKGTYWNKIRTSNYGEKWVYYNGNLSTLTLDERFNGYSEPNFSNKVSGFSPTTVRITAKYGDWYQFQSSNFGNLWVNISESSQSFELPLESNNYIITSRFGPRGSGFHNGIDLAQNGTVRIVAAASGVVSRSYYNSSWGEVVFIRHTINGRSYETIYAHMRSGSRQVSVGQSVSQGQFLGYMGSTGDSTGQHLHFEIHNGSYKNPVDPENFIDF
ncbi:peptidoglycan DD-metalloendopeptidase family protein [Ornithinibacillus salinisoli]|uniref:Peptidoglycan DD-metalloendopeptidase family protein n=1 Tax=Ornithinibacillus salinisoli TaxID=1848459 RepID=A0ABW4W5C7_9BACI